MYVNLGIEHHEKQESLYCQPKQCKQKSLDIAIDLYCLIPPTNWFHLMTPSCQYVQEPYERCIPYEKW